MMLDQLFDNNQSFSKSKWVKLSFLGFITLTQTGAVKDYNTIEWHEEGSNFTAPTVKQISSGQFKM